METEPLLVGVVMQRVAISSRWQSHAWRLHDVLVDQAYPAKPPACIQADPDDARWCFAGLNVRLYSDEAEGYFLNIGAPSPCWFVMSRPEVVDGVELQVPKVVTLSYNEAARLMDGGERVDTLAAPVEIVERMGIFVKTYYQPEEKRKRKKPSFEGGAGVDLMARAEGQHGRK